MRDATARALGWSAAALLAVCAAVATYAVWQTGTYDRRRQTDSAEALTGGDAARGYRVIVASGCGACHEIPGIPGAYGLVAAPLATIASRTTIGGVAPNTPQNLVHWIENPRASSPATAMPALGLSEGDARDVAAYLYARTK